MYRERLSALTEQIAAREATNDDRKRVFLAQNEDMQKVFECMHVITLRAMFQDFGIDPETEGVGDDAYRKARDSAIMAIYSVNDRAESYGLPPVFEIDRTLIDILLDLNKDFQTSGSEDLG